MAKKRKRSNQARITRQYEDLLYNAKQIYNDMYLALKLGSETPSFEQLLNYAGTSSGLKRPTKQSIKALKKMQSETGILQQAYGKLSMKSEAFKQVSKMLEEEQRTKDLLGRKKQRIRVKKGSKEKQREDKLNYYEEATAKGERNAIKTIIKATRAVEAELSGKKVLNSKEDDILRNCYDLLEYIENILVGGDDKEIDALEDNLKEYIYVYGTPGIYEFYGTNYPITKSAMLGDIKRMKQAGSIIDEYRTNKDIPTTLEAPPVFNEAAGKDDPYANFNMVDPLENDDGFELE